MRLSTAWASGDDMAERLQRASLRLSAVYPDWTGSKAGSTLYIAARP